MPPVEDPACVQCRHEMMDRDRDVVVAVDHRPVDGRPSSATWERCIVDIDERAQANQIIGRRRAVER